MAEAISNAPIPKERAVRRSRMYAIGLDIGIASLCGFVAAGVYPTVSDAQKLIRYCGSG